MTKVEFGKLLLARTKSDFYDVRQLSRWAYEVYLSNIQRLEPGLRDLLLDLSRMEDAEEFEFSRTELLELAHTLVGSGE